MADKDFDAALSRAELMEIVTRDLGTKDLKLLDYKVEAFSENPMGFLGVHIKIRATVEVSEETKTRNYFAKKIPEDIPSHNSYAKGTRAFFKEIEYFESVVKDVRLNTSSVTKWCPEFYFARGAEILVVEDLCPQGFYMYPERALMELDHIIATVRAMAAMHAGPMLVEQMLKDGKARHLPKNWAPGQPTDLRHLYSHIVYETECNDDPTHPGNRFYEAGFRSQPAIVDLLPGYTSNQRANIKKQLPDILRRIFRFVKPSDKFRNTWVHGDLWSNNIMFRNDSDKVEAVIIDFQLARLVPPAHDLVMFVHQEKKSQKVRHLKLLVFSQLRICYSIWETTAEVKNITEQNSHVQSRSFLTKHQAEIFDAYYKALTDEVEAEGYDVEVILPRSQFDESCAFYYEFALLSQVMFYQMTLSPTHITSKFLSSPELFDLNMLTDRTEMVVETYKTDELCRRRITEAMDELIQFYKLAE